jgi:hypothetical protein
MTLGFLPERQPNSTKAWESLIPKMVPRGDADVTLMSRLRKLSLAVITRRRMLPEHEERPSMFVRELGVGKAYPPSDWTPAS